MGDGRWGRSRRRRRPTWILAWLVLVPVLSVVLPPVVTPVSAAACDADGDGTAAGFTDTWLTTGDDATADRLAEDTGRHLSDAPAGYRWDVPVCVEGDALAITGSVRRVLAPDAGRWQAEALVSGMSALEGLYWSPAPRMKPDVDGMQVVGLETWLAIDPATWVDLYHTAVSGEVTVQFHARPTATIWVFSDQVLRCDGPGVEYTDGAPGPPPCGRDWEHTTSVGAMTMEVYIEYTVGWVSSIGQSGSFTDTGAPLARYDLSVGEVQAIGTLGDADSPTSSGLAPDLPYDDPADCSLLEFAEGLCGESRQGGSDCGQFSWNGVVGCLGDGLGAVVDVGEWVLDNVTELVLQIEALLPDWAKKILDVLEGCVEFGIDALTGLWDTAQELASAARDPVGFVKEQLETLQTLMAAIEEDPQAFAQQFLGDLAELDLLESDPAKWIGKMGCEVAFAIITGGAGGSVRIARLTEKMDDITDWLRRRDRDRDGDKAGDGDAITCGLNSFPTGTLVLMAEGRYRPIEAVRAGDRVMSHDPTSGQWHPGTVVDQWWHLDDGRMATARLGDGSSVTATDHHRFWVVNRGRWVELDDVRSGDRFLSPTGVTEVADVIVSDPTTTLVWELDVETNDNFAVSTGSTAVLVHNNDCRPSGNLSDAERQEIPAGSELGDLDPVDPSVLNAALEGFQKGEFNLNGQRILLEKDDMATILSRHHPRYFGGDGTGARDLNTSFDGSLSPADLVDMADDIIRTGTREVRTGGVKVTKTIDGIEYEIFVNTVTGHINHFTPIDPG